MSQSNSGVNSRRKALLPTGVMRLLLAVVFLQANAALADDCIVASSGPATLRGQPSATSDERGTLAQGQSLPLVASMRNWYETRTADGRAAFASKRSADVAPCPAGIATMASAGTGMFEVHAIDVGTGLAVLVKGPDFALLYDAGSNDDMARGANNRVLAYLATLSPPLQKLDHVVLSHPHRDHVELLPDVITKYKPGDVWNSGAYNDICGYRNFLFAIAANKSIKYHTANRDAGPGPVELSKKTCYGKPQAKQTLTMTHSGRITTDKITLGQNATMSFLYADGSKRASPNENSLVVQLDLGQRSVLFMGDAEAGGRKAPSTPPEEDSIEGKLLECCAADLKSDVLIVGHHGSKTSSRAKFLDAVKAKIYVVSAGPTKYSSVVLPDKEIVTELDNRGDVFRTDLDDAACRKSTQKVGVKGDSKPGGCDNIVVKIPMTGPIAAEYRRQDD